MFRIRLAKRKLSKIYGTRPYTIYLKLRGQAGCTGTFGHKYRYFDSRGLGLTYLDSLNPIRPCARARPSAQSSVSSAKSPRPPGATRVWKFWNFVLADPRTTKAGLLLLLVFGFFALVASASTSFPPKSSRESLNNPRANRTSPRFAIQAVGLTTCRLERRQRGCGEQDHSTDPGIRDGVDAAQT